MQRGWQHHQCAAVIHQGACMTPRSTVQLVGLLVASVATFAVIIAAGPSPAAMAKAANAFLESLTAEQRQQATFAFESAERTHWHFIPTEGFARNGLTIKQMT